MNHAILKTSTPEQPLSELQLAEELIKQEMLIMLHNDAVKNPTAQQAIRSRVTLHKDFLAKHPYEQVNDVDMKAADDLLRQEMTAVADGMGHNVTPETFEKVWDECLSQVLFVPSQSRYTRANYASKKDKVDALEKRLEQNRGHMSKEAKKAGKFEKKFQLVFGGYQKRAASLTAELIKTVDQAEQVRLERETFTRLQQHEVNAIQKRINVSMAPYLHTHTLTSCCSIVFCVTICGCVFASCLCVRIEANSNFVSRFERKHTQQQCVHSYMSVRRNIVCKKSKRNHKVIKH